MIDEQWLSDTVSKHQPRPDVDEAVARMREFLEQRAQGFASQRADVVSSTIVWPRRGLLPDESASFLRAVADGVAEVDQAGFVTMPTVKPKLPPGRYALFSKSGSGISINLEYLIQIGASAELILDYHWPSSQVEFERGPFDALGVSRTGRVLLAVEAKARVSGPDSLHGLMSHWFTAVSRPATDLHNTSGRKLVELMRLCKTGPVHLWLVADSARWSLIAEDAGGRLALHQSPPPRWEYFAGRSGQPQ